MCDKYINAIQLFCYIIWITLLFCSSNSTNNIINDLKRGKLLLIRLSIPILANDAFFILKRSRVIHCDSINSSLLHSLVNKNARIYILPQNFPQSREICSRINYIRNSVQKINCIKRFHKIEKQCLYDLFLFFIWFSYLFSLCIIHCVHICRFS